MGKTENQQLILEIFWSIVVERGGYMSKRLNATRHRPGFYFSALFDAGFVHTGDGRVR